MIEVSDLTVRFGGVTPLDGMSVTFESGHVRPDRAQRRRQDDVLQRAQRVRPPGGRQRSSAFGEDLLKMAHFRRARWGVRRTFQTEQAIEELSVYDNVAMIHEHSKLSGSSRREDVLGAISFVGHRRRTRTRRSARSAPRERRLVEVARAVVGKPRLVLLDEPAAGLPDEETEHLGDVIRRIPEHIGAQTILVDHDMSLVSALLRDDRGARLRQAARLGPDRRGAARRARDPRLPRDRGGDVSDATLDDRDDATARRCTRTTDR